MKYVPSAFVGRLSRSAGSTTAAHNRFGAYLRNRVIPTNPATAAQTVARNSLQSFSTAWRSLSETNREAWTNIGLSMVRTDSLGQTYTLTGLQAYVSANRNLELVGGIVPLTAPWAWAPPTGPTAVAVTGAAA